MHAQEKRLLWIAQHYQFQGRPILSYYISSDLASDLAQLLTETSSKWLLQSRPTCSNFLVTYLKHLLPVEPKGRRNCVHCHLSYIIRIYVIYEKRAEKLHLALHPNKICCLNYLPHCNSGTFSSKRLQPDMWLYPCSVNGWCMGVSPMNVLHCFSVVSIQPDQAVYTDCRYSLSLSLVPRWPCAVNKRL